MSRSTSPSWRSLRQPQSRSSSPLLQHGDHLRNVVGIVLQVAVQRRQQPAARHVDAGLQGGRLAEIALQLDDPEVEPFAGEFLARIDKRGVRRAIIDDDQFPRLAEILESTADTLDERRDAFFLVVDRNEDGKLDFAFRLVGDKRKGLGLQHCISPGRSGFGPPCYISGLF